MFAPKPCEMPASAADAGYLREHTFHFTTCHFTTKTLVTLLLSLYYKNTFSKVTCHSTFSQVSALVWHEFSRVGSLIYEFPRVGGLINKSSKVKALAHPPYTRPAC